MLTEIYSPYGISIPQGVEIGRQIIRSNKLAGLYQINLQIDLDNMDMEFHLTFQDG